MEIRPEIHQGCLSVIYIFLRNFSLGIPLENLSKTLSKNPTVFHGFKDFFENFILGLL